MNGNLSEKGRNANMFYYLQTNSCGEHTEPKKAPTKQKIQRWNFMNKLVCAVRLFSNKSAER